MKRLSLNSDGAFRTIIQRRMPHSRKRNSTKKEIKYTLFEAWILHYGNKVCLKRMFIVIYQFDSCRTINLYHNVDIDRTFQKYFIYYFIVYWIKAILYFVSKEIVCLFWVLYFAFELIKAYLCCFLNDEGKYVLLFG